MWRLPGSTSRRAWNTWCRRNWDRARKSVCIPVRQPLVTLSMSTKRKQTRKMYRAERHLVKRLPEVESVQCQKQENEHGSTNQILDQEKQLQSNHGQTVLLPAGLPHRQ